MAERKGFEPSMRGYRIFPQQGSAFDHSATSPLPYGTSVYKALSVLVGLVCLAFCLSGPLWVQLEIKHGKYQT